MASEPGPPESMFDTWSSAAPAEMPWSGVIQGAKVGNIWELEMSVPVCPLVQYYRLTRVPLSPGPLDGHGFLKRTSLFFTLVRNLGEVCQFNAFLVNVCFVFVAPMPDQVFRGFRHFRDVYSHMDIHSASYQHFLFWGPACFSVYLKKSIATEAAIRNSYFLPVWLSG